VNSAMKKRRLIRELIRIVGKDGVVVDPVERRVYETDGLHPSRPGLLRFSAGS